MSVRSTLVFGALVALALPPSVFFAVALAEGLPLGETVAALVAQYSAPRQNLLVCGAVGLFPIALLTGVLWLVGRLAPQIEYRSALALGGVLPILAVLVWVNLEFWPLFLPSRTYPGFPHGLEFVIGPGVFAPIAMFIGVLIAWVTSRRAL